MHILLIHQAFVGLNEAGGTRHIEMARHLVSKGHQVTIIAGTTNYLTGVERRPGLLWKHTEVVEPGITVIHSWSYAALHRGFLPRLISFFSFMFSSFLAGLEVRNIDIIWGTSPPIFQAFSAWLLAFLKRRTFLFEVRDLWPDFAVAMGVLRNKVLIMLSLWLERFLYKRAVVVVVNSPGYSEPVRAKGARRIELVPNGVDPRMFDPDLDVSPLRRELGLDGKFIVVYAGAHGPSNDLWMLLETAEIVKKHDAIHFLLVGDGKEKPALQAAAKSSELTNVTFLPPVPKNEMKRVFALADACIAILKPLELYKTTYPNKVFDYMAAGRAVILAIDGVIRQVVQTAKAGIFVSPGDPQALAKAVIDLCAHPKSVRQMGLSGRKYVLENFDRTIFTEQFENILNQIVE